MPNPPLDPQSKEIGEAAEPLVERCGAANFPPDAIGGSFVCGLPKGHEGKHYSDYDTGCEWDDKTGLRGHRAAQGQGEGLNEAQYAEIERQAESWGDEPQAAVRGLVAVLRSAQAQLEQVKGERDEARYREGRRIKDLRQGCVQRRLPS